MKVARTVLRGGANSNVSPVLDVRHEVANKSCGTLKL